MTLEDISQYETVRGDYVKTDFGSYDVYAAGSSSGGALLLNTLENIKAGSIFYFFFLDV